ncbi:Retrovirus-related Pol polyprotein from transposon RE2 [Vitis vinifera]|uniref:Retrovirus-related Pol polyprotein from transposon RE2 n=1 Tax=Vitis vinifera TaxID=29760 RepID=A0A438GZV0_VITVI|nr:Retrovirus-related Pol polyprotein from transposon RE2 [Vitis vinifera]
MANPENVLSIQAFHQCSSLVSIKLNMSNLLLWRSQVLPLVRSLGLIHHLSENRHASEETMGTETKETHDQSIETWSHNDGLLTSWLLGLMTEEVMLLLDGIETAYDVWNSLGEKLLPMTKEKEVQLTNRLRGKPVSDLDKVFQLAQGLGTKYMDFRVAMLSKPPYPSYNQFVLALQGHEQMIMTENEENKESINHEQSYFTQRGRGRNRGGRFLSRGRGFTPAGRFNNNATSDQRQNVHSSTRNPRNIFNNQFPPQQINTRNPRNSFNNQFPPQQKLQKSEGTLICQICSKANHSALDCWNRFDYSYQSEEIPQALAAMALHEEEKDPNFYVDSGATAHITNDPSKMSQVIPYKGHDAIFVGNGEALRISHIGEARLKTKHRDLKLKKLLVVPEIKKNLLSIRQLTSDNACSIEFSSTGFVIKDQLQQVLARGTKKGGLYALEENVIQAMTVTRSSKASSEVWHQRMAHPQTKSIKLLQDKKFIEVSSWMKSATIPIEMVSFSTSDASCETSKIDHQTKSWKENTANQSSNSKKCSHCPCTTEQRNQFSVEGRISARCNNNQNTEASCVNSTGTPTAVATEISTVAASKNDHNTVVTTETPTDVALGASDHNSHTATTTGTLSQIESTNSYKPAKKNEHVDPSLQNKSTSHSADDEVLDSSKQIVVDISPPQGQHTDNKGTHMITRTLKIPHWLKAMQEEIKALIQNRTWDLVPRPPTTNIVGSKWVFKTKLKEDGTIDRYKARLVARVILGWKMRQLDVKNAFLHGFLKEEVFMEQPPGFINETIPMSSSSGVLLWQSRLVSIYSSQRYLKGTMEHGIKFFKQSSLRLTGFCDADWVGCTRRSTSGYCIFLGANCISWSSKRQPTVSRSSAKAEYRSLASSAAEITWLTFLLRDIGIQLREPPQLLCDNLSALHMTVNPVFHARSKHIELDYHFVREKVARGVLITRFLPSSLQVADIFTKALPKTSFQFFRFKLGVHKLPLTSLRGTDKGNSDKGNSNSASRS